MNKLWSALSLLLLLLCTASCNLYRRLGNRPKAAPGMDSSLVTVKRDAAIVLPDTLALHDSVGVMLPSDTVKLALLQQWSPLWSRRNTFSTFSGKARVHYESGTESQDFTAAIRIEKDRQIWMSVTVFGGTIEFLRARITPDSAFVIDRLHRETRAMPLSEVGALLALPANFGALQSILAGEPLSLGIPLQQADIVADTISLGGTAGAASQELHYSKYDTLLRWQRLISTTAAVELNYADYKIAGTRLFAHQRRIYLFQNSDATQSSITLDFSKAAFDEPVELPFDIPQKYERK